MKNRLIYFCTFFCLNFITAAQGTETAILRSPAQLEILADGKPFGSIKIPTGGSVEVLSVSADKALIKRGAAQAWVDHSQLDIPIATTIVSPSPTPINPSPIIASNTQKETKSTIKPVVIPTTSVRSSPSTFTIKIGNNPVTVKRIGNGPIGVTFFPHSDSQMMEKLIIQEKFSLCSSLQQCSFFVWSYPEGDFSRCVKESINGYLQNRDSSQNIHPPFDGLASSIVSQIEEQSGIKQMLLVGNSLGAGIILWDYSKLLEDPERRFLLISPSKPFLPQTTGTSLPPLKNTVLLASEERARGWHDESKNSADLFITEEMLPWIIKYRDEEICQLLLKKNERAAKPTFRSGGNFKVYPDEVFLTGHKTIGNEIQIGLLNKLIRISLGLTDKSIILQNP